MTEADWLVCENSRDMIQFLRGFTPWQGLAAHNRKYRLFACASVRGMLDLDEDEASRSAVAVAERLADGQVTPEELAEARSAGTKGAARKTLVRSAKMAANDVCTSGRPELNHTSILRCIVGNPFRPISIDPAVLTATVTSLARAAYDDRIMPSGELEGDRLAVLSDAVEEAGCDDFAILEHLRSPGPHYRGCHVLDLLLGNK